jgi:hypothetical protein
MKRFAFVLLMGLAFMTLGTASMALDTPAADIPAASVQDQSTSTPAERLVVADGNIPQLILAFCEQVVANPNAEPSCMSECISFLDTCQNERTGRFIPSNSCFSDLAQVIKACRGF